MNDEGKSKIASEKEIEQCILEIKRAWNKSNGGVYIDDGMNLNFIVTTCDDCEGYKEEINVEIPRLVWNFIDVKYGDDKWSYIENFVADYGQVSIDVGKTQWFDPCFCDEEDEG